MANRKHRTPLDAGFGDFEAQIQQEAKSHVNSINYKLPLSDAARLAANKVGEIAVLKMQQQAAFLYKNSTGESLHNALAPIAYQEVLFNLMTMEPINEKRIVGGAVDYVQPGSDGTYHDLPSQTVEILPVFEARALGYVIPTQYPIAVEQPVDLSNPDGPQHWVTTYDPVTEDDNFALVLIKAIDSKDNPALGNAVRATQSNIVGGIIQVVLDATPSLVIMTTEAAAMAGYTVPDTFNGRSVEPTDFFEVITVPKIAGPVGPVGPAGTNGTNGTNGIDGAIGPVGPAGTNGTNGTNGIDGAIGPVGPGGPQGPAGVCPDCSNPPPGPQPTGPGPQPPGATGGGTDGTQPGGGSWSGSGAAGTDTATCGQPVQIYEKSLSGLRSWLFAPSQLLPTDFDYANVNLRAAIDAVGANTFPNYDPANLISATLILDMPYLVTETVPIPSGVPVVYTPVNTLPRLYSDTARASLLGEWVGGTDTNFSIDFQLSSSSVTGLLTVGLSDMEPITIDVSGQKPVYIDGSVVPVPLIAQIVQTALEGRNSARIFVSCLTYHNPNPCAATSALQGAKQVPFTYNPANCSVQSADAVNYHNGSGCIENFNGWGIGPAFRGDFTGRGFEAFHLYGFTVGKTYSFQLETTNYYSMDLSMDLDIPYPDGTGSTPIFHAGPATIAGTGGPNAGFYEYGRWTAPDGTDPCAAYAVHLNRTSNDFALSFRILEV